MTLEIEKLSYDIDQICLIKDINLSLKAGILYGILGPNGSGKSTLLKTIARIWRPSSGNVFWEGQNLFNFSRLELSRTLSFVPQNPSSTFDFTVYQMVAMGCYSHSTTNIIQKHEYICQALEMVDAWHLRNRVVAQLSGGERQKIYIARALATQAPIILLDEPTSHLDVRHQLEIWQLLQTLSQQGKLIIAALHDLFAARRFCEQLIVLNQGKCQAVGSYDEILSNHVLETIFGVYLRKDTGELVISNEKNF